MTKGANIEAKDRFGQSVLGCAAEYGHMAVVQMLLNEGANIKACDGGGRTALTWAIVHGDKAIVELLVAHGAKFDLKDFELTEIERFRRTFGI